MEQTPKPRLRPPLYISVFIKNSYTHHTLYSYVILHVSFLPAKDGGVLVLSMESCEAKLQY
jgi:hypothetical protein